MTFWEWFKADGDHVFGFFSLLSIALQGQTDLPPPVTHWAVVAGVIATVAHQSFFPTTPVKPAAKEMT